MTETKASVRQRCLKKFREMPVHSKRYSDHRLSRRLTAAINAIGAQKILLFWPLETEPDIRPLIGQLRRSKVLYLPFMEGVSFKMVPLRLPLVRKAFGIYEAGNTTKKIKNIDVAIVPAVGVDARARRIGFGKGMYDRFFADLKQKPVIIFVQSTYCYTDKNVCDDYDISADQLLTPRAAFTAARINHVKRNTLRRWHCHA